VIDFGDIVMADETKEKKPAKPAGEDVAAAYCLRRGKELAARIKAGQYPRKRG
jgi:hypothetical protein